MSIIGKILKFPQKTSDYNQNLYNNNLFYLRILSVFRALFFMIPVWVSMELQYISLTQVAIIDTSILVGTILLELPTGALADLIGRKKSVCVSFVASAIAYFLFAYANSFTAFLIAGLGFSVGDALLSGALEALVFDTLKQNKKEHTFSEVNNQNNLIFNYSIFVAIIIGGLIFEKHYHLPSVLTGISLLIAAFVSLKFIEPDVDSEKFTLKNYLFQTKMGFKEMFKNRQARDISFFYILVGAFTYPIVLTFKNFSLVDLGLSEKNIGLILAFASICAIQLLHWLIRKRVFERLKVVFLLPAILLSVFLPLSYFYQVPSMIGIIFVVLFVSSMRWNVLGKLSNQCYSSKNRATAISSLSMMISFAYILALIIFSILNEHTPHAVRTIFLIMSAGSILLLLPISIKLTKRYHNKVLETYD